MRNYHDDDYDDDGFGRHSLGMWKLAEEFDKLLRAPNARERRTEFVGVQRDREGFTRSDCAWLMSCGVRAEVVR